MSSTTDNSAISKSRWAGEDGQTYALRQPFRRREVPASAWLQLAGFFIAALAFDQFLAGGDRFAGMHPHPFWIPVIILSLQFGTNAGLIAVLASCAALFAGNMPEQALTEDRFDYVLRLSSQPILWLATALVVGEIRSRQIRHTHHLAEDRERLEVERNTIAAAYQDVKNTKTELERRIAGQARTAAAICETVAGTGAAEEAVLDHAHLIVRTILSPRKFSLFLLNHDVLKGVSNEGWEDDEGLERRFGHDSGIFRAIVGEQRILCAARREDEAVLESQGLLAGPLRDKRTGEVLGMLKVEGAGFQELSLDLLGIFQGVCELIGMAIADRSRIETLEEARFRSGQGLLLAPGTYAGMAALLGALGRQMGFQILEVSISAPRTLALQTDGLKEFATALSGAVSEAGGPAALVFDRQEDGLEYTILLPHRSKEPSFVRPENLRQSIIRRLAVNGDVRPENLLVRSRWLEAADA
jgi:polysaccharide biosynthesis protein PelD